ncbi:MAG TPA: amidase [Myxococcales bacterium]|nr:amidase [Myxococcales bacterium]
MNDYEDYDALGLAELVKNGETTAEALLEAAILRTEKRDGEIGSIVIRMFEEARETVAAGVPSGPFEGVPFLLKDLHLAYPGVRLTNGSKLFAENVPEVESELVARYRRAGLVIFGKTHSPEYGLTTSSESKIFGQTKNPWNLGHTAGGSSGGASAAVAAGILPLANASDGGGSIRIPASCCGLFGMKPTRGRTPLGPNSGEGWAGMSAVHAVGRSVRDSAALLDATSGADLGAPYAGQPPTRPYLEEVGQSPGKLRIAIQMKAWNGFDPHPDCVAALRDAETLCRELGHEVEEAPFEVDTSVLAPATLTILSANTRAMMEERAQALGRDLREDDVEPGTWGLSMLAKGRSAIDYVNAVRVIHATGRALARHLQPYDMVLSPTMATPPHPLGLLSLSNPDSAAQGVAVLQTVGYTQIANATGHPAMSVPLYWNDEGLPIGVQFLGRMDAEGMLYRLAGQLEAARPWFNRRPSIATSLGSGA